MKRMSLLIFFIILPPFCFSGDIYDFFTIQGNFANGFYFQTHDPETLGFQENAGFAIGAEFETNLGDFLIRHGALHGAIPLAESPAGPRLDLGLSFILYSSIDYVDFFSFFPGNSFNTTIEGRYKANFIGAFDLGTRIYAHWYLAE